MNAEELCRSIYEETAAFYKYKAPRVAGQDLGYRILYGPPTVRPEYLFLGDQPGGKADSVRIDQLQGWPTECEYALDNGALRKAGWKNNRLASNMQKIWGIPTLRNSTGLNAIFFRAPDSKEWRRLESRRQLEDFSLERVRRIVETLQPKRLAVIGLQTFRRLAHSTTPALSNGSGRPLIEQGKVWGVPAFGVIHLSGARISGGDLNAIKNYFVEL